MSKPTLIAEYGVEGGGETIFGREQDGAWLFWSEGSSGGILDDLDEDPVREWKTDERADLASLVPDWFHFAHPVALHPNFADQLIALWRQACLKANFAQHDGEHSWLRAVERWAEADKRRAHT